MAWLKFRAVGLLTSVIAADCLRAQTVQISNSRTFRAVAIPARFVEAPREAVSSLPPDLSLGTLMAYEPKSPANNDLFLFLPGSEAACSFYSQLLETVGSSMYTLCMPYDNRKAIAMMCLLSKRCYERLRVQALDGDFQKVHGNNIERRLASALRYMTMHGSSSWKRYLDASGEPVWGSVRVSGHSQGAGAAAMIGYKKQVARVVQFSGTCDRSDWLERLGPPVTPPGRWYGFAHDGDTLCSAAKLQERSWIAEGALEKAASPLHLTHQENISRSFLGGYRTVVTHILPPDCGAGRGTSSKDGKTCGLKGHESTASNAWAPELSPYAAGLWQALVGL